MEYENVAKLPPILLADDDDDLCNLIQHAFKQLFISNPLYRVPDGEELMQWLYRQGKYQDLMAYPTPSLILLDILMPRRNGIEALQAIKADPYLKSIPVIMLTSSNDQRDIKQCYELGCNSYIQKPTDFQKLMEVLKVFRDYWLSLVKIY